MITKILLAGFIAIFVNILGATAQHTPDANGIIYVKEGSAGNGSSWTNATGNLQNAIDADDVQQVWVAKGTYQPPSGQSFSMKPGVVIYGGFPDTNDNAGMADRNWATYLTKLQGNGTCVVINADNALTSADILDGFTITGGNEGGIISAKSSPSYVNLVITGNSATFGGGVYIVSAAPRLTNVLISGNGAIYGGGMVNFSSPILTNVTISGNSAFYSNGSEWYNSATPVIRNSIIYGYGVDGQLTDVQNSLVQNQTNAAYTDALNNNLPTATDPLFASSVGGNYTLQATSPAINKGNNAFFVGLNADTKDLTGNSRVNDFSNSGIIDIGAYEYRVIPLVPDSNGIIYVRQSGTGNGSSWAEATVYFQAAINTAGVQQVWVAQGAYQPAPGQSFTMKQGVAIYGGFPAIDENANMSHRNWVTNVTTLQGNGSSVVKNEDNALISSDLLDGFTITGGIADLGAGILNTNSSPGYRNLVITQNTANLAGGGILISDSSAPKLTNVLISGNTAVWYGGGVNNSSPSIFTNVTVSGNTAAVGSEWNEVYSAVVRNSIVYGNGVHGALNNTQNSLVQNQTHVAYNDAANNNLPTITDPLFANPAVGNYALQPASPAIDKGNVTFFNGLDPYTKDLGGNLRLYDDAIDLGAYESQIIRPVPNANGVVFVRQGGSGSVKGNSWENALGDLQQAINLSSVQQVWAAKGTYQPTLGQSFIMKHNVSIYGGFPDNDDNAGMDDRDWATHPTTLQGNGSSVIRNEENALTPADILDGFIITGGYSDSGGGISNAYTSPSYINLVISGNTASNTGGGIAILGAGTAPHLINVLIHGNTAQYGGGVWNSVSSPLLTNVTISGNTVSQLYSAAEWYNFYSGSPVIRNSIIYGNGVGFHFDNIQNSLAQNQEGNSSYEETGNNNLSTNTDPLFTDSAAGTYTLKSLSPAVNKGKNSFFDGLNVDTKDLKGNPRLLGSSIDIGAFESPDAALPVRLVSFEGRLNDQQRAVLTWKTDEINTSHYEIERSSNARDFHMAGTVTAGGNGSANYIFTDPTPVSANCYYRIRLVDQDDTFSYSRMISLTIEGLSKLFAYPNPIRDRVTVELGAAYLGSKVRLLSITGAVLQETEVKEKNVTLDMSRHAPGIYLLQLQHGRVVKLIKE